MSDPVPLDRAAIERRQWGALRPLLETLRCQNRFYAPRLERARLPEQGLTLTDYFDRMPFTLKSELVADQQANPPFGTNLTFPLERYTRFHQTSGTSGAPMRWLDTAESWIWVAEHWAQVFRVAGVGAEDRIFFAFSFGPFLGFWAAFEAGGRLGCLCLPGGGMSSAARLRAILDNGATVLCCTPTYAIRLGEVAAEEGIDLSASRVRVLILAGEPGGSVPAVRARLEQVWRGARPFDHHGMTETGPVTYECPSRPGVLHIMEGGFIPEVIAPETGARLAPGATGELVLTNLGRVGSPLLRYRTGDLVHWSAEARCLCGRYEMALEGGILGRTDDMAVVRGVNLYPSAVEAVVRQFAEVAEYRAELYTERAMQEIRLYIEPSARCANPVQLAHDLEVALRAAFNLRVPIQLAPPGSLPRFELKAQRWVRS